MTEQLQNSLVDPTGNLNANITNSATSFALQSGQGANFPASGNFRIKIGSELILVGARSTDTLSSLTRGIEGTTGASHSAGDSVDLVLTKVGIDAYLSSQELDYVEFTSNVTISSTTEASPTDIVVGNAITLDGSTRIKLEFFAVAADGTSGQLVANFWDGSTDLGRFTVLLGGTDLGVYGCRFLTPSNGSHTYKARGWKGSGTVVVLADVGGTGKKIPGFIRVTKA